MAKRAKFSIYSMFTVALMLGSVTAYAQKSEGLLNKADNLRERYRFDESFEIYAQARAAAQQENDSLMLRTIDDHILMSENGRSMTSFVYSPTVVARHKFSTEDFFLYYPLEDKSWRAVPNQLDSASGHRFAKALYAPSDSRRLFWSAQDSEGIRDIYTSILQGEEWSVPVLLNEQMTSVADEVYPLLSADGKKLYFSSAGLYGVGGYDLFVSEWDDEQQEWSSPENLGFPYSSPADDFLFYNTPDGRYTMFASNRDCPKDSIWIYVLDYDNMPIRRSVEDPAELVRIASLEPAAKEERMGKTDVKTDIPENVDTRKYMDKMSLVRQLRDSISTYAALLGTPHGGNAGARITALRESLTKAQSELQKIEMDFLFKGVVIDPEKLMVEADREIINERSGYAFSKRSMGDKLNLKLHVPEVKFDYSFKILDEGQFAEDQTLPSGVVYQIQIFASKNKAAVKSFKGLSPVYESRGTNGHYVYRVGVFRTYNDVLSNLNAVKKVGFKSAYIVPFIDGKVVKLATAKAQESVQKVEQVFYEVRIVPEGGSLDSTVSSGVRQQAGGKDIARVQSSDGKTVYVVGPFDNKTKADDLVAFIKAMGVSNVTTNKVK